MGVFHIAFQFYATDFHKRLQNQMLIDGNWYPEYARALARKIISKAPPDALETLMSFRFDTSWLTYEEVEDSTPTDWYVIFLTTMLTKSPSLSNRFVGNYEILRKLLPVAGWSLEEINKLLIGRNLNTLVEASENRILIENITGLEQYGGWLDAVDIQSLLKQFVEVKDLFYSPSPSALDRIAHFSSLWNTEPRALARLAYLDGFEMLSTANQAGSDLFLILE